MPSSEMLDGWNISMQGSLNVCPCVHPTVSLSAALARSANLLSPHVLVWIKNLKTWRLLLYVIQSVLTSFASVKDFDYEVLIIYLFVCLFVLFPQILLQVVDKFCFWLFYCDVWLSCVVNHKQIQTLFVVDFDLFNGL